jgi:septum formation inhibitor-activating ATPase MinD
MYIKQALVKDKRFPELYMLLPPKPEIKKTSIPNRCKTYVQAVAAGF